MRDVGLCDDEAPLDDHQDSRQFVSDSSHTDTDAIADRNLSLNDHIHWSRAFKEREKKRISRKVNAAVN